MSKLISFIGGPGSGKTILACALKEYFMLRNISTDVCTEYAREFVFKYGFPEHPSEQYRLGLKQKEREDLLCKGTNRYIFSDSPIWLTYAYCMLITSQADKYHTQSILPEIYEEFVIKHINRYEKVFYIKNVTPFDDGCKRDTETEDKIRRLIDGFVNTHFDLLPIVEIPYAINQSEERKQFVYDELEGDVDGLQRSEKK
jgi:nicotinamide riboside kinase